MKVLIVYCHPSKKSYTFEMLQRLQTELATEQHTVDISDLYAQDFQSDMTEGEYEREGFSNLSLPVPTDVQHEQRKLAWADVVIFLYPVWWSDCPAKLKGWFDRVYTVGYVYKHKDNLDKLKSIPHGYVLCTAGYTTEELTASGMAQSMKSVMVTDRLGSRFDHKAFVILGGTLDKENVRAIHHQQIAELVKGMN